MEPEIVDTYTEPIIETVPIVDDIPQSVTETQVPVNHQEPELPKEETQQKQPNRRENVDEPGDVPSRPSNNRNQPRKDAYPQPTGRQPQNHNSRPSSDQYPQPSAYGNNKRGGPRGESDQYNQQQGNPQAQQVYTNEPQSGNSRENSNRNIEIERQSDLNKQKQQEPPRPRSYTDEDYQRLVQGGQGMDYLEYLEHYKPYSEAFYNYIDGTFKEGVIPLYTQIRAHPFLSMGVSAVIFLYVIIFVTRYISSFFKRKVRIFWYVL